MAQLVASMSGVVLGGVVEVVDLHINWMKNSADFVWLASSLHQELADLLQKEINPGSARY